MRSTSPFLFSLLALITYFCPIKPASAQPSSGPEDCAIKARQFDYRGAFTSQESIDLCRDGGNTQTAECAIKAMQFDDYRQRFTSQESIDLCRNGGTMRNAECAIKARQFDYREGFTVQQSIDLCKTK